jgi:hypothetical protein
MKPNPISDWSITLSGAKPAQALTATHRGTIDDALSEADVLECQVNWQVRRVELQTIRTKPAKKRTRA